MSNVDNEPVSQGWMISNVSGEGDAFFAGTGTGSFRAGENTETRMIDGTFRVIGKKLPALDSGGIQFTYLGDITALNPHLDMSFVTLNKDNPEKYTNFYNNGVLTYSHGAFSAEYGDTWDTVLGIGTLRDSSGKRFYYCFTDVYKAPALVAGGVGRIFKLDDNFNYIDLLTIDRTLADGKPNVLDRHMPVLSEYNRILWGYGNTIFQIDEYEVIKKVFTLPDWAEIVEITKYQSHYKLYYNIVKGGGNYDSYIAYWDGFSVAFKGQPSFYQNDKIMSVINNGAYDYAFFKHSFARNLYYVGGIDRGEPIKVSTEGGLFNSRELCLTNMRELNGFVRGGILYFVGINKFQNICLYSFSRLYPGGPVSLVPENVLGGTDSFGKTPVISLDDNSFIIYEENKIFQRQFEVTADASGQTARMITYPILGNFGRNSRKELQRIYVSYDLVDKDNIINIYYRKNAKVTRVDNYTGWEKVCTIGDGTLEELEKISTRIDKINLTGETEVNLGFFNTLEFMIELVIPELGKMTQSPIFYSLKVIYKDYPAG